MPRPLPPEPLVNTAVRIPTSIHRELHRTANDRDTSVNRLVVRAVERYLDELNSDDRQPA